MEVPTLKIGILLYFGYKYHATIFHQVSAKLDQIRRFIVKNNLPLIKCYYSYIFYFMLIDILELLFQSHDFRFEHRE